VTQACWDDDRGRLPATLACDGAAGQRALRTGRTPRAQQANQTRDRLIRRLVSRTKAMVVPLERRSWRVHRGKGACRCTPIRIEESCR
jgi:hypothetical protein